MWSDGLISLGGPAHIYVVSISDYVGTAHTLQKFYNFMWLTFMYKVIENREVLNYLTYPVRLGPIITIN